jgi:hypothetical protein
MECYYLQCFVGQHILSVIIRGVHNNYTKVTYGGLWNLLTKCAYKHNTGKGKAIPVQAYSGPEFEEAGVPRYWDIWYMKVVRVSALCTEEHSWYSLLLDVELTPRAIVWPEGLSMKTSNDTIITPSGIEPTNFRLVAQCLNQMCPHKCSK